MIGKKFCPRCGREVKKLYDGLCARCYVETHEVLPKKIELKRCKVCKKYFVGNKAFERIEPAVELLLRKYLRDRFDNVYFRVSNNQVVVHIDGAEVVSQIKLKWFVCERCKKREREVAVIQVRGNVETVKKILNEIERLVSSSRDKTLKIIKIKEMKNGYDIHLSSKRSIRRIVKLIKDKYNIEVKTSRKLMGMKDSRKVYKDFILVRVIE